MKRQWYLCPYCGKRLLQYDQGAISKKVYIKCKNCKKEIEIKID